MRDVALASSNIAAEARQRLADAEAELASYEARGASIERLKRDESVINQLHEVRQTLQREAREAAQAYRDLVTETTASQLDQLDVLTMIASYGEDSVEVARLRAEQEGIALGLIKKELADYIAIEMAIRDAEKATVATVAAAFRIGPALQTAINQANTFARAMISAANAAAGIRINTAGVVAQTQALAGGASPAEAAALGAATSLRGSLERDAMAAGATSISSDRRRDIEAQVSDLYASQLASGRADA